ncbi:MAG TPA: DUF2802 domain-containing protein [Pseudomonadales bacterium]|nr:DUF2802 domain-containing protein [Planctomycetaceae bacterium]HMY96630.1 DUF2802 domain-containing protein [Pseudomonadales bacterium]
MTDLSALEQSWPALLLFFSTLLASCLLARMQFNRFEKKITSDLKVLAQTVALIEQSSFGFGRNLHLIERNVKELRMLHDELESKSGAENLYLQAAQVAEMGATAAELMNNFGLSKVEAKLIEALHAARADARLH